jgi:hypothetical protein
MRTLAFGSFVLLAIVLSASPARAGLGEQGVQLQGVQLQGVQLQGVQLQGVQLQGVQLQGVQLQGVQLQGVQLQGSQLTGYNGSTYLSGAQMEDSYLQAKFSNGQTAWMYVVDAKTSTKENTLASSTYRSNSDVWLYRIMLYTDAGWMDPCPNDHYGMLMSGVYNTDGKWSSSTTQLTLACSSGVVYKCAHNWGYKPWKGMWDAYSQWHSPAAIRDLHQTCVHAARAAYCGSVASFTHDGNAVDMFDNYGFNTPLSEGATQGMFAMEAYFDINGAYEIFDQTRNGLYASEQGFSCLTISQEYQYQTAAAPSTINGQTYANKQQWLIDGGWSSPQTAFQLGLNHIAVSTSTACTHSPALLGDSLATDCNTCTRSVCAAHPDCCVLDKYYEGHWDSTCVAAAQQLCGNQLWSEPRPFFDDAYEDNDLISAAKSLYFGFLNGLWVTAADHDFYKFPWGQAATEVTYDQAAGDVNVRVWQNGSVLSSSVGTTGRETITVPAGGTLEVYASGTTANVYHLAINGWDANDELASETCVWDSAGASRTTAAPIDHGYYSSLGVCNGGAAWFSTARAIRVQVSFAASAGNLNAASYDSNGYIYGASTGTGNVETITVPAGGTFQVYGVSGASNEFSLTILPTSGTEPGDPVVIGTEPFLSNSIYPAGDADEIIAEYGGTAVLAFEHDRGDLGLASYDRSGTLVGLSVTTSDVETVTVPTGGRVRVFGYSGVTNAYSLTLLR